MYVTVSGVRLRLSDRGSETGVTRHSPHAQTGSARNDIFYSASSDTNSGLGGDDSYHIWNTNNRVIESADAGVDTVFANYWGVYTLAANVENLVLVGGGMSWNTGNDLKNIMAAGSASSFLDGGAGSDVLVGGGGRDIFNFRKGNGSDAIERFDRSVDQIRLQNHGVSSYAALEAMTSQAGADAVISLPNGEKIVVRDTAATALSANNFVLANTSAWQTSVGSVTTVPGALSYLADAAGYATKNGWIVIGNDYGAGALVEGRDYTIRGAYQASDLTSGTTFTWSFPKIATALYTPPVVLAYPEIIFGNSPKSGFASNPGDTENVFPVRVDTIADLTVKHDVGFSGDTRGFDVAYDLWLTSSATGGRETITNEVMIWIHQGDFAAFGDYVGAYTDGSFAATVYHSAEQDLTSIVANADTPAATINIARIIGYLRERGIVSGAEYLRNVELGAEVVSGSGSLTLNDVEIMVKTANADGSTTTKAVTGAGTTVSHAEQVSFVGTSGVDTLIGNGSDNSISGAAGNDIIDGGAGNDRLDGGTGNDTVSYNSATSRVSVNLSLNGVAQNSLGAGVDTIINAENLIGSPFDDKLIGDVNANRISGGAGQDTIFGGSGDDIIRGGPGRDALYGGRGADHFVYGNVVESRATAFDTIHDFRPGEGDKIDLSAIDANSLMAGIQHFTFMPSSFDGAGDLRISYGSASASLLGYTDGDQTADFVIRLNGIDSSHTLGSGDLILV